MKWVCKFVLVQLLTVSHCLFLLELLNERCHAGIYVAVTAASGYDSALYNKYFRILKQNEIKLVFLR